MVEKIIVLGFEQDIYLPDEFPGMYHFLSIIAYRRQRQLQKCEDHADQRRLQFAQSSRWNEAQETAQSTSFIDSEKQQASGINAFAKALRDFYTIASYLQLLPCPNRPFSTEPLRYELRMKPFLGLQPLEVPSFEEFQDDIQPYGPYAEPEAAFFDDLKNGESELWTDIDAAIKTAKNAFGQTKKYGAGNSKAGGVAQAWEKEIQGLLASCIALSLAVTGLKRAAQKIEAGQKATVTLELPEANQRKRYVEGWVVPKVIEH